MILTVVFCSTIPQMADIERIKDTLDSLSPEVILELEEHFLGFLSRGNSERDKEGRLKILALAKACQSKQSSLLPQPFRSSSSSSSPQSSTSLQTSRSSPSSPSSHLSQLPFQSQSSQEPELPQRPQSSRYPYYDRFFNKLQGSRKEHRAQTLSRALQYLVNVSDKEPKSEDLTSIFTLQRKDVSTPIRAVQANHGSAPNPIRQQLAAPIGLLCDCYEGLTEAEYISAVGQCLLDIMLVKTRSYLLSYDQSQKPLKEKTTFILNWIAQLRHHPGTHAYGRYRRQLRRRMERGMRFEILGEGLEEGIFARLGKLLQRAL